MSVTLLIEQDFVSADTTPTVMVSVVPSTAGLHQLPACAFANVSVMLLNAIGALVVRPVLPLSTSTTIVARRNWTFADVSENVTFCPVVECGHVI